MPLEQSECSTPIRVLLVDDDDASGELLEVLLVRRGFHVTIARSVSSALAAAEAAKVDILVSDLGLPDGSGHELLRQLRAVGRLPAIAVSGLDRTAGVKSSSGAE